MSINLIKLFPSGSKIVVKDFVIGDSEISKMGLINATGPLGDAVASSDVVLFMNNHSSNSDFDVIESLNRSKKRKLFFDGWDMFDQEEIEGNTHIVYATMGYMTKCN